MHVCPLCKETQEQPFEDICASVHTCRKCAEGFNENTTPDHHHEVIDNLYTYLSAKVHRNK